MLIKSALRGSWLLSSEALTPEILRGGEVSLRRFDPKSAAPFVNKSVSEETRRAYRRAVSEFFHFAGMKHPAEVVPHDVVLWRDRLRSQKKSAATVAFKLSVVRSYFEYLKAAGACLSTRPRRGWSLRPNCRRRRRGGPSLLKRCATCYPARTGRSRVARGTTR